MRPAGFRVTPSTGAPMLIIDQARAIERAAVLHGTVTPLYSLAQVAAELERIGGHDYAADAVASLDGGAE